MKVSQVGQRAAFFLPLPFRERNTARRAVTSCVVAVEVEVELKHVLRYMPFGVLTYPQLRREMKRCVETGAPWPFVLAVIPSSSKQRRLRAGQHKQSARPWFHSLATSRLKPV